jgi:hypothetical protein
MTIIKNNILNSSEEHDTQYSTEYNAFENNTENNISVDDNPTSYDPFYEPSDEDVKKNLIEEFDKAYYEELEKKQVDWSGYAQFMLDNFLEEIEEESEKTESHDKED